MGKPAVMNAVASLALRTTGRLPSVGRLAALLEDCSAMADALKHEQQIPAEVAAQVEAAYLAVATCLASKGR